MDTPDPSNVLTPVEPDLQPASAAPVGGAGEEGRGDAAAADGAAPAIRTYDFRNPVLISGKELRKLRTHHEVIADGLSARLSNYLRLDVQLRVTEVQSVTYRAFTETLGDACHLTLFKVEPLRGICVLNLSPALGLALVDRLMGGSGAHATAERPLSEIELALLDQVVHLILQEWCGHWGKIQELKPELLGHESTGRFLQTSHPDALVVTVAIEARLGESVEQIVLGLPFSTLEPLIRALAAEPVRGERPLPGHAPTSLKWNHALDDLPICLAADWCGLRLTARQVAGLQPGDVLPLPADFSGRVRLSLAKTPKFTARLGSCEGCWAVEITGLLQTPKAP